jgi:hypothetical protein
MNPSCSLCERPVEGKIHKIELHGVRYELCDWDALRLKDLLEYIKSSHVVNIFWGAGHVNFTCWDTIRDILRAYEIKEVLEFGIGLSSELFVNEGIKVIGFDTCRPHVELYQKLVSLQGRGARFHHYEDGKIGPPVEVLYPGRTWDFVFVDGPQERSREVQAAMRVARKFIYLHDPNMGEEDFFPNDEWEGIGTEPRLFKRKATAK